MILEISEENGLDCIELNKKSGVDPFYDLVNNAHRKIGRNQLIQRMRDERNLILHIFPDLEFRSLFQI